MGHAWMPLEIHDDECAKATGDVHTLYIRQGDSPWKQRFKRVGVVCSACYRVNLDSYWIQENEDNYVTVTVKRKIPASRRRSNKVWRKKEKGKLPYINGLY